jgi:hypothetical protein
MSTQIQDWANDEEYLHEFEEVWSDYRRVVAEGITRLSEIQLRDLFQRLSLIEVHSEMRMAVV